MILDARVQQALWAALWTAVSLTTVSCTEERSPTEPPTGAPSQTDPTRLPSAPAAVVPAEVTPADWPPTGTPSAKNAVLIVLDTTRADAVQRASTPRLDALATAGARVERSWSGGTWTVPSVVTLLTGRFVRHHGWDRPAARMGQYPPLPDVPRLPEVLSDAGFSTAGLYSNPYLSEPLGFDRGFDNWTRTGDSQMAKKVAQHTAQWSTGPERRHFLYVHLLGPHSPLRPSDAARSRWDVDARWFDEKHGFTVGAAKRNKEPGVREAYKRAYHAAIEDTDALVAGVLDALGPHLQDTLVVVTSDHGELLGEHGAAGHGWWLWEPLTHVPLIVDHPHAASETLPPILANAAVPDLITRGTGVPAVWPVDLTQAPLLAAQREGREAIALDGRRKLTFDERIVSKLAHQDSKDSVLPVVFDLDADASESDPQQPTAAEQAARDTLDATAPRTELTSATQGLSTDTQAELKTLGYVE